MIGLPPDDASLAAPARMPAVEPLPLQASAYGPPFWFAYLSNTAAMLAISLLYRFADFVKVLGGLEFHLGWIVGVGMVGSLLMRFAQGMGIDRFGPKQIWFWSTIVFAGSCLAHLLLTSVHGPAVYILQIVLRTSVAGVFGASITYISSRVPPQRVPEIIGTLGTSGFLGMMGGTLLGDWLFGAGPVTRQHVDTMFVVAAALAALSAFFSLLAMRRHVRRPKRRKTPPLLWLLRRYHPGSLLLVGVAVGLGTGLPTTFLRPYTESLGIPGIMVFFWVYAPMALVTRLASRQMPQRIGTRRMVLLGMACLAASVALYLVVHRTWQLAIPALVAGAAHALLFPAVTGGGSTCFPHRYRGTGITLMLAMYDLGNLIGAPLAGVLVHGSQRLGLPPFPTAFTTIAALLAGVALLYAWRSRGQGELNGHPKPKRRRKPKHARADHAILPVGAAAPSTPALCSRGVTPLGNAPPGIGTSAGG